MSEGRNFRSRGSVMFGSHPSQPCTTYPHTHTHTYTQITLSLCLSLSVCLCLSLFLSTLIVVVCTYIARLFPFSRSPTPSSDTRWFFYSILVYDARITAEASQPSKLRPFGIHFAQKFTSLLIYSVNIQPTCNR